MGGDRSGNGEIQCDLNVRGEVLFMACHQWNQPKQWVSAVDRNE
jgi:hypothetical protein